MPSRVQIDRMKAVGLAALALAVMATEVFARSPASVARAGIDAFTSNCFSPRMTAETAANALGLANVSHDFYDLDPFTSAAPSPAKTSPTPGTDRRCEVSFPGDFAQDAVTAVAARLLREGITEPASVPAIHEDLRSRGTVLLAARRLNPQKIAVVHVGTRPGANGIETFLNVERLRLPN